MIHSHHGVTAIKGTSLEILEEYLSLSCSLLHTVPEMFIAVQLELAEDSMNLLPQLDQEKIEVFTKQAKEFIKDNKEAGTWDD